jgi:hypothetical protein
VFSSCERSFDVDNNYKVSLFIFYYLFYISSIDEEKRIKIRAEWKQNSQSCSDDYKSAVYGLFLGFDCPTVNKTIEDWLWARLISCKWAAESTRAFRQLQTTICAQHGFFKIFTINTFIYVI